MGDPVRWRLLVLISQDCELARGALERMMPVGKDVISRQTKVLAEAGLIEVRRRGRQVSYVLRRDTVDHVTGVLEGLVLGETPLAPAAMGAPASPVAAELADVLEFPLGRRT